MDSNNDDWISSIRKLCHVSSSQRDLPENETPSDDESDDDANSTPVESTHIRMLSLPDACTDEEDECTPPENDKYHTPPERMIKDGICTDEEETPSKKRKVDELEEEEMIRTLLDLRGEGKKDWMMEGIERVEFGSGSLGRCSSGDDEAEEGEGGKSARVKMEIEGLSSREKVGGVGEKCMTVKNSGSCAVEYGNREAEVVDTEIEGTSVAENENDEMEEDVEKNVGKEDGLSGVDCNNSERVREEFGSESLGRWSSGDDEVKEGEDGKSGGVEIKLEGLDEEEDFVVECVIVKNLESSGVGYRNKEVEVVESEEDLTAMKLVEHQAEEGMDENVRREEGSSEVDQNNEEMERKDIESESLCRWTSGNNVVKEGEDRKLEGVEMEIEGLGSREKVDNMVKECMMMKNLESSRVECRNMEVEVVKSEIQGLGITDKVDDEIKEHVEKNVRMAEEGTEREKLESVSLCRWTSGDDEVEDGELGGVEMEIEGLQSSEKVDDTVKECVMVKNLESSRVECGNLEMEVAKSEIQGLGITDKVDDEVKKEGAKKTMRMVEKDGWLLREESESLCRWTSGDDEVEEGEDGESGVSGMVMGPLGVWERVDDHMVLEEGVQKNLGQIGVGYSNGKREMLVVKSEINVLNVENAISSNAKKAAANKEGSSAVDSNLGVDCNNRDVKFVESEIEGDQGREYVADEVEEHEERNSIKKFKYRSAREGMEKVVNDENGGAGAENSLENEEGIGDVEVVKYIDPNAKSMNSCARKLPAWNAGQGEGSTAGEEDRADEVDNCMDGAWTALLGILNRLANQERQTRKRKCCCQHTPKCCERSCCEGLDLVEMAKNHGMNFP